MKTTTRKAIDGVTVVTVTCGAMVAYRSEYQGRAGLWTVQIGRKAAQSRVSAACIRGDKRYLRSHEYSRALYKVEIGKA